MRDRMTNDNAAKGQPVRHVEAQGFGGPEVLQWREAPEPRPTEQQVLVDVAAVSVLQLDVQIRSGWGELFGIQPPYVPGSGFVGRVTEIGAAVEPSWIGRTVAVDTGNRGGYVQRGVVDADQLISVPDGVDVETAAALLHDGRTAEGLREAVSLKAGDRVLVLGAAGGLGLLLVQLSRSAGTHVVAAARGAKKRELAAAVGARATVDYSDTDWLDRARAACGGDHAFDVIFDGIGGELGAAAFAVIATSGRFSAHGAASGGFAAVDPELAEARSVKLNGIEAVQFAPSDARRLTAAAFDAAAAGNIRAVIGQSFRLARAMDAHRAIEAREVIGKTVLLNDVSPAQARGLTSTVV